MSNVSGLTTVSKYFTAGDFARTSQPVTNEIPIEYLPQIKQMAVILDEIYDRIGSFDLISGFRSYELQEILNAGPHNRGTKSFHEIGQAVDIVPHSDLRAYFSAMLADPSIRYAFADISYKPWDGSLHLEAPERADTSGRARIKELGGSYRTLSLTEIDEYIQEPEAFETVALVKKAGVPIAIGLLSLGVGIYLYTRD